ncbi:DinB family protein [Flexivirga meconopsidis]|uniref:DinB family protein n=1 Tax=Flexivirga meconopsidis TaxID=2977121 RepID=UPI00223F5288|nr:DinB family protein [Flexivirga meconopsidis]
MTTPAFDLSARVDPPLQADEAQTLRAYLDYHRDTFRAKTGGLTAEQLNTALAPSDMTLGGMVKHLALVETSWLVERFAGQPAPEPWASVDWEADVDWDWHSAADDTPEQLTALYEESVRLADEVLQPALRNGGLGALSAQRSRRENEEFSLRWIVVHLIEEYARHNGHADLIRQSVDGATGE